MQAVKGVEIGYAEEGARPLRRESAGDTIHYEREERRFTRAQIAPVGSRAG
jgi:hypothetical protein